jgi:glycosyltransferase involved in cell wall biosynthesis
VREKSSNREGVIHVTTVHPWWDNRIYEKMVSMLPSKGWKVSYVAQFPDGAPSVEGINFVPIRTGGGFGNRVLRNVDAFRKCLGLKRQIVHFHDPEFLPFGILLRILGYQVVYDIHEDNLLGNRQKYHLPAIVRVGAAYGIATMELLASRLLTIVIAENVYSRRFPRGIRVLNYLKSGELVDANGKEEIEPSKAIGSGVRSMIYTGTVSEDRGAFLHVELMRSLPSHELHVVGRCDDNLREQLILRAGEAIDRLHLKVSAVGIPYGEIEAYYRSRKWDWALAVFPFTRHYFEKELTKFFEYMFYRIPIVCSDFPVWRRLVERARGGICVDPGNIQGAAALIQARATEFDEYRRGSPRLDPEFMWESQLDNLDATYRSLVGRNE